jgi:hypothetical protein
MLCVVFWNSDVSSEIQNGVSSYLSELVSTDYFDGLSEYGMSVRFCLVFLFGWLFVVCMLGSVCKFVC